MKAIGFREFGPPEVLEVVEVPDPKPGPGEVIVRVGAVSVGRLLDIGARAGKLPWARIELPHVLGSEHAGEIAAVGEGVEGLQVGARVGVYHAIACKNCVYCRSGREHICPAIEVLGIHRHGAYAEYTRVPAENVRPLSDDVSYVEAAALMGNGPVAWAQLDAVGLREGQWILVQAAGSALGSITAILAKHKGARVIGTTRHEDKLAELERLGMEATLNWTDADFVERVRDLTDGAGVEVVVDNIGNEEMFAKSMAVLARGGVLVTSGAFVGGTPPLDLRSLYTLSQRIVGIRTGNLASVAGFLQEVDNGLRPIVDREFPISRAAEAHAYVERDENLGRVVLVHPRNN